MRRPSLSEAAIQREMARWNLGRITAIRRIQSRKALLASSALDGAPLHYVPFTERRK